MKSSTNAARSQGGDRCGASLTSWSKSNVDSSPALSDAYARKNEPSRASAMPTDPISRYFQVASSERAL